MNAELVKALRVCADCTDLQYGTGRERCTISLMRTAADALEAAEKRIAELEAQMPKDGKRMINIKWDYQQPTAIINVASQSATINVETTFLCRSTGKLCPNATQYGYCKQTICNNCGARMKTVTDCHTLEEGER